MTPALRLLLLPVILLALTQHVYSQKKKEEFFYAYDENWKGTTLEHAVYIEHVQKFSDTCWQWDTYNLWGPMIKSEQYKDKEGSIPHGRFAFYNESGRIDSLTRFRNNLAEGSWFYFNDTAKVILQKNYANGKLIRTIDYLKTDSLNELVKPDTSIKTFTKIEVESEFKGGAGSWRSFLEKNIRYPDRALSAEKQGTVHVWFVVDKEGNVSDATIFISVEYSLDEEALRIINRSPRWTPAIQNGRQVRSYKRQPIMFGLK
ncbi:MAG: TonB family protein [Chitinophagaceae bacterium]